MKDLDLTSLRYFVAVCESGNITRTAEQAHLVASAVSKRLSQLEDDLDVPLLQRQRRGVTPTTAGELLLEQARSLLASAKEMAFSKRALPWRSGRAAASSISRRMAMADMRTP